jgi:hypothetical protein
LGQPIGGGYLGAGRLRSKTLKEQGLELSAEMREVVAGAPYAAGIAPYLPLLPLITDRHVDALTLAGTKNGLVVVPTDGSRLASRRLECRPHGDEPLP